MYLRDRAMRALSWACVGVAYAADWIEAIARSLGTWAVERAAAAAIAVSPEYNARLESARLKRIQREQEQLHRQVR